MVASVPELTKRIISRPGMNDCTSLANSISRGEQAPKLVPWAAAWRIESTTAGQACPRMSGPQDKT